MPPKGIKRKNFEGSELLDCEGQELDPIELQHEVEGEHRDEIAKSMKTFEPDGEVTKNERK